MIKVLNLYASIGGNRKLWKDVKVTAVELNPDIARIYQDFFPLDKVIVTDAHQYLLEHYDDGWDFIWSSPPCPSHSKIRNVAGVGRGQVKPVYPDMSLYEEIIFLKNCFTSSGVSFNGKYCVENVVSYYEPLIPPIEWGRHYFWANFNITPYKHIHRNKDDIQSLRERYGFRNIKDIKVLRNCVDPELGLHILNQAFKYKQTSPF